MQKHLREYSTFLYLLTSGFIRRYSPLLNTAFSKWCQIKSNVHPYSEGVAFFNFAADFDQFVIII